MMGKRIWVVLVLNAIVWLIYSSFHVTIIGGLQKAIKLQSSK